MSHFAYFNTVKKWYFHNRLVAQLRNLQDDTLYDIGVIPGRVSTLNGSALL